MKPKRVGLVRARKAAGYTQEQLADALHIDRSTVVRWEGTDCEPLPFLQPKLAKLLGLTPSKLSELLAEKPVASAPRTTRAAATPTPVDAAGSLEIPAGTFSGVDAEIPAPGATRDDLVSVGSPDGGTDYVPVSRRVFLASGAAAAMAPLPETLNLVRAQADILLDTQSVSDSSLDHWEEIADHYGVLELSTPSHIFLTQVTQSFNEVQNVLTRRQPMRAQKRLYRVMAQFAGLIALKTNDLGIESQQWFHTAQRAAAEIEDDQLRAWLMAHESMTYLWFGRPVERAVGLAQAAQTLAGDRPNAAAGLAAAIEARAHARLGRRDETLAAVKRSDDVFDHLTPSETKPSIYGLHEHLLRFCQSYALTAVGETGAVIEVQQRSFDLPGGNAVDAKLTRMDRATCLIGRGEAEEGARLASDTLLALPAKSRPALITHRAHDIRHLLPSGSKYASTLDDVLNSGTIDAPSPVQQIGPAT